MSGHGAGHGTHPAKGGSDRTRILQVIFGIFLSVYVINLFLDHRKVTRANDAVQAQAAAEQRKIDATKPQPSGEGIATMNRPLVADINPRISKIEPIVPPGTVVKYTLITNPKIFFYDTAGYEMDRSARVRKWRSMPTGVYSLAPLDNEPITIKWSTP